MSRSGWLPEPSRSRSTASWANCRVSAAANGEARYRLKNVSSSAVPPGDSGPSLRKGAAVGAASIAYQALPLYCRAPRLVLNPSTPVVAVEEALQFADYVLVMSVNPGFGGQKFIPQSIDKVRRLRRMIDERQLNVRIEIDGGIDRKNIETVVEAGAEIIVAGSAIFGTPDAEAAVRELREATVQWV